jgi:hypothetical protein
MSSLAAGQAAGSRALSGLLVAMVVAGGAFIAAETDALPTSLQAQAHELFGAPAPTVFGQRARTKRPAAEANASPSPESTGRAQSISELCSTYTKAPEAARSAELGLKYRPLVIAAGGNAKVAPFCAVLTGTTG